MISIASTVQPSPHTMYGKGNPQTKFNKTSDATIIDRQVRLKVFMAGSPPVEVFIEYPHRTRGSARALPVQYFQNVVGAADEAEVLLDALAHLHSTVTSSFHDEDLLLF